MRRGLPTLFESGTPVLVLAAIVLVGGMGYGFYQARHAPAEPANAEAVQTAPADTK